MDRPRASRAAARRYLARMPAIWYALALPLLFVLVGCGGSSSTHTPITPTSLPPTSLEVSRTVPTVYWQPPINFLPFDKTYDDVTAIQTFYTQTLALPPFPTGVTGPNNGCGPVLIPYHLTFRHETTTILAGTVTVGNCGDLRLSIERGLPTNDVRDVHVGYFTDLARVLGLTTEELLPHAHPPTITPTP